MQVVKVVVFGKGKAGKSTLIQQIIPEAMNIERDGRTVAMDFGLVTHQGWKFHFWGTPGQVRFEPVREILAMGVDVAIFVNDSSRFFDEEDRKILQEMRTEHVPYILFINHKPEGQKERRSSERLLKDFPAPACIVEGSAKSDEVVSQLLAALAEVVVKK